MLSPRIAVACARSFAVIALAFAGSSCQRDAAAQAPPPQGIREPLGPLYCYEAAVDAEVSQQSALELCASALSGAPGQCYAQGIDRFHELSSQSVLSLCARATNLEPLACYQRLRDEGVLTEGQMVAYCTTACPLGPAPPEASSSECLAAAINNTDLSLQSAGQLCLRSSSTAPVQCYLAGQRFQSVAQSSMVQLCAENYQCTYYNAPSGGY